MGSTIYSGSETVVEKIDWERLWGLILFDVWDVFDDNTSDAQDSWTVCFYWFYLGQYQKCLKKAGSQWYL